MTNYLAQIVTRAKGGEESNPMRPGLRHRYTTESGDSIDSIEADIMPSDSGIFFDKPDTLAADRESRSQATQVLNNDPKRPYDSSQNRPERDFGQDEFSLSPSLHKEVSPTLYNDKLAEGRPDEKGESKNANPIDPVSFETNLNHMQPHARKPPSLSPANKSEVSEGKTIPIEPAGGSPKVFLQPEFTPKNSKKIDQRAPRETSSVPVLRPTAPATPLPSAAHTTKSNEPRLVIGRLKVEVVSAPVKTQQRPVRKAPRAVRAQTESGKTPCDSKLRFGLGQV